MTAKKIGIVGEVLFDQFPDGQQLLGGAPFNVAWHLQAFGAAVDFISRVGSDALGERIRQAMLAWRMPAGALQTDSDYPTGIVKITINNGEPGYEILDNQAYDYIASAQLDPEAHYSIIYHGTLALRHTASEQALNDLKTRHRGKIFIDVNLRNPWWRQECVDRWLADGDVVKLNHEELMRLMHSQGSLKDLMRSFLTRHRLETLIVTCGSEGAVALTDRDEFVEVAPTEHLTVVDTVGAGDAFASIVLLGILLDWPLPLTMSRARDFASALVTRKGATVEDLSFYRSFIAAWQLG